MRAQLVCMLGLVAPHSAALRVDPTGAAKAVPLGQRVSQASKAAVALAACSAALLSEPTLALAPSPTLNEAIVEVSETSYPILKALKPEAFQPFTEKVANLVLDIKPDKLGKSIDLGIDVFNSVPEATLNSFNDAVKEAFADLKPDSCTLVPLPPTSVAERFASIAAETVDAAKLKAAQDKWGGTLGSLAKTDQAICLPSVASLDKLALAQADVGRSFGAEETKKFGDYTLPLLKRSITIGKVLPLASDAKKVAPNASPKDKAAFQAAGKAIEQAAKMEQFQQQRAAAASRAASAPAAAARPAASRPAAAPQPTAEELAEKKQAAQAAEDAKKAAFKEAQLAQIAELKAKRAAIEAAKNGQ